MVSNADIRSDVSALYLRVGFLFDQLSSIEQAIGNISGDSEGQDNSEVLEAIASVKTDLNGLLQSTGGSELQEADDQRSDLSEQLETITEKIEAIPTGSSSSSESDSKILEALDELPNAVASAVQTEADGGGAELEALSRLDLAVERLYKAFEAKPIAPTVEAIATGLKVRFDELGTGQLSIIEEFEPITESLEEVFRSVEAIREDASKAAEAEALEALKALLLEQLSTVLASQGNLATSGLVLEAIASSQQAILDDNATRQTDANNAATANTNSLRDTINTVRPVVASVAALSERLSTVEESLIQILRATAAIAQSMETNHNVLLDLVQAADDSADIKAAETRLQAQIGAGMTGIAEMRQKLDSAVKVISEGADVEGIVEGLKDAIAQSGDSSAVDSGNSDSNEAEKELTLITVSFDQIQTFGNARMQSNNGILTIEALDNTRYNSGFSDVINEIQAEGEYIQMKCSGPGFYGLTESKGAKSWTSSRVAWYLLPTGNARIFSGNAYANSTGMDFTDGDTIRITITNYGFELGRFLNGNYEYVGEYRTGSSRRPLSPWGCFYAPGSNVSELLVGAVA